MKDFKFSCLFLIFVVFLVCLSDVESKHHHHHGNENDSNSGGDELLPAVCANGETMLKSKHQADLDSFKNCKYQRMDAVAWMDKGFDMDGDGALSMRECELARRYYLHPWEVAVAESCDTVFLHCDCDGDGLITKDDFANAIFTCLRNCDTVMTIDKYIASRMKGDVAYNGKK